VGGFVTLTMRQRVLVLLGLAAAMSATRMSHFGTASLLPDASLAVFLLGGLVLQRLCGFSVLMAVAFGVDVVSARTAVEAGWCLTPAYWGLIPTYGLLWLAGRWLAKQCRLDFMTSASVTLVAVAGAFLISNAFWFALSNTATDLGVTQYASAVAKYFPPYLGSALLYLAPLWLGWKLTRASSSRKPENT
jgi:hypothetical protein